MDEALLERAIQTSDPTPVVRIYRWAGPALSLGAHQRISEDVVRNCELLGVELVRRPTGGSAVLHGNDLTYCVVAPLGSMSVMRAYRWVAEGLIAGLGHLGLVAGVAEHPPPDGPGGSRAIHPLAACFDSAVGADLQVAGAKICGSAQLRRKGRFLQHGSIPVFDDRQLSRRLLSPHAAGRSTCLENLRPGISWQEATQGLIRGFEDAWGPYLQAEEERLLPGRIPGRLLA